MRCPFCGADDTRVVDSRPVDAGAAIRRRRLCESCDNRFTTYERRDPVLMVRKRDGRLQPFDPAKVRVGVAAAMAGRDAGSGAIDGVVAAVEAFAAEHGPELTSEQIGRAVLHELRRVDEVGYLRFASVYKDFAGAEDFEREMATLDEAPITPA